MLVRWLWMIMIVTLLGGAVALPKDADAGEFIVYSIYKGLEFGDANEAPQKDYYLNMGSAQGLKAGAVVEVMRRTPTYDLTNQKLYQDVTFPIAKLKVIHVERNAAVARLDKMNPVDKTPSITPRAVMVGDIIRPAE